MPSFTKFCLTVFLDIEKAYDSAWRYGIISDLKSFGVSGNLLTTLVSYSSERPFRVNLGSALSKAHVQKMACRKVVC